MFDSERIHGELFVDAQLAAIFSDRATLQAMLDFEAALARAEAECGVIPGSAVAAIIRCCDAALYDPAEIGRQATLAGNPAIPLVKMLTAAVAAHDAEAARFVHFGATSQDVIDSGRARQANAAGDILLQRADALAAALATLALAHRHTPVIGRTFLQQAVPVSFGLKAALWLDPVRVFCSEWRRVGRQPASLAGAAGSLAALGPDAVPVREAFGRICGAPGVNHLPTHAIRTHGAAIAMQLGALAGHLGKIARDIGLMAQTEIGELAEPDAPGKGGSSTMPHKRNPVLCTAILANAQRTPGLVATMLAAMPQEHERGLGGWHAEWRTLVELFAAVGAALQQALTLIRGLQVFPDKMRANIDLTQGLVMAERIAIALAGRIGRGEAHHLVEAASRTTATTGMHLQAVLAAEPAVKAHLTAAELADLFDPSTYRGATDRMIDEAIECYRRDCAPAGAHQTRSSAPTSSEPLSEGR